MTDDQFERIKKGLNFHSEGGVYNLCTLTETALREIIEDAVKFYEKQQKIDAEQIRALQKQNGELTDELKDLRQSIKDYGAGCYENGLRNGKRKLEEQLTKAIDILQRLMENQPTPSSMYAEIDLVGWREVNKEAKQFLKEIKEK